MDKTELYKKIQEIRVALQEMDLTKSGYNKFSDYKYFELSDFLPKIQKLALEKGIIPIYQLEKEQAILHICDIENVDNHITFTIPTADAAFEIAENDFINNAKMSDEQTPDENLYELINDVKVKALQDVIREKGLSESSILERYKIDDFHDMVLSQWMKAMEILSKQPDMKEV